MNFEKKEFGKTNSALYDSQDIIVLSNNRNIKLINDHESNDNIYLKKITRRKNSSPDKFFVKKE
jgi:hypothetical protein